MHGERRPARSQVDGHCWPMTLDCLSPSAPPDAAGVKLLTESLGRGHCLFSSPLTLPLPSLLLLFPKPPVPIHPPRSPVTGDGGTQAENRNRSRGGDLAGACVCVCTHLSTAPTSPDT